MANSDHSHTAPVRGQEARDERKLRHVRCSTPLKKSSAPLLFQGEPDESNNRSSDAVTSAS